MKDGPNYINKLPYGVLDLILDYASAGKAITPALGALNHKFRDRYNHVIAGRTHLYNDEQLNTAFMLQQDEINYLLVNKNQILENSFKCPVVADSFSKLLASTKKGPLSDQHFFQVREEILNQLNAAIIRKRMDPTRNYLFCGGCHLTRFPGNVLTVEYAAALEGLDLAGNKLTTIAPEIMQLSALQTLDLSNNQLTTVPSEIKQLKSLHTLDLSRNRLTAVPSEIDQMTSLQALYLDRNQLVELPDNFREQILYTCPVDIHGIPDMPTHTTIEEMMASQEFIRARPRM